MKLGAECESIFSVCRTTIVAEPRSEGAGPNIWETPWLAYHLDPQLAQRVVPGWRCFTSTLRALNLNDDQCHHQNQCLSGSVV